MAACHITGVAGWRAPVATVRVDSEGDGAWRIGVVGALADCACDRRGFRADESESDRLVSTDLTDHDSNPRGSARVRNNLALTANKQQHVAPQYVGRKPGV